MVRNGVSGVSETWEGSFLGGGFCQSGQGRRGPHHGWGGVGSIKMLAVMENLDQKLSKMEQYLRNITFLAMTRTKKKKNKKRNTIVIMSKKS